MTTPLHIELSYPAESLSPNARAHHMVVARYKKAARNEAFWATRFVMKTGWSPDVEPIPVKLIYHPKPTGPTMDKDNAVASCKAHLDGIAQALGVNDRAFDTPTVEFADRKPNGALTIIIGG